MNNISPDPGNDDKHAGWKIVGDDVVGHFPLQNQLEASDRVISWEGVTLAYIDRHISYKLLRPVSTRETLSSSLSSDISTQ